MDKKISIIIIAYDVERYIRQCLDSVLAQTYKNLEIIVVVGIGKDKCEEIVREYQAQDDRIKAVYTEPHGAVDARNRGMKLVTGDYLGFVDADDYIEPFMFERLLSNITEYDADISIGGRFYEYQNRTLSDNAAHPVVYSAADALRVTVSHSGFFLHLWDKLYSKKIFEGLIFDPDYIVEDRIVVDKLLIKASRVVYDSTPMYHFRERSGSMSKRKGMNRENVRANEYMRDFLIANCPEIKDDVNAFIAYEYVTAVQNELVSDNPDKENIEHCISKIKEMSLSEKNNPKMSKSLKLKMLAAVKTPEFLGKYTRKRQKKTSDQLRRFP